MIMIGQQLIAHVYKKCMKDKINATSYNFQIIITVSFLLAL